jgi:hypothetical protein
MLEGFGVADGDGEYVNWGRLTTEVPIIVSLSLVVGVSVVAVSCGDGCPVFTGVQAERSNKEEVINHKTRMSRSRKLLVVTTSVVRAGRRLKSSLQILDLQRESIMAKV